MKIEVRGEEYEVFDDFMTDLDTLDMLDDLSKGNPVKTKKLLVHIFGEDSDKALATLRDENGRISVFDAEAFVTEAFQAANLGE